MSFADAGLMRTAFIEKMLTLDTAGRYFIRTCGEEPMVAYNRVGLTGQSPAE
jgi:NAD(P)H-nitrite reductase large subunit